MTWVVPSARFCGRRKGDVAVNGCLAMERRVSPLDVPSALGGTAPPMDRGHGRYSVCGQTLTVTRVPAR